MVFCTFHYTATAPICTTLTLQEVRHSTSITSTSITSTSILCHNHIESAQYVLIDSSPRYMRGATRSPVQTQVCISSTSWIPDHHHHPSARKQSAEQVQQGVPSAPVTQGQRLHTWRPHPKGEESHVQQPLIRFGDVQQPTVPGGINILSTVQKGHMTGSRLTWHMQSLAMLPSAICNHLHTAVWQYKCGLVPPRNAYMQ